MAKVDPRKKKKPAGTTWTDSKGTIIQARKGTKERVGAHISTERGKGGKGEPGWFKRQGNQLKALSEAVGDSVRDSLKIKNTTRKTSDRLRRATRTIGASTAEERKLKNSKLDKKKKTNSNKKKPTRRTFQRGQRKLY
tara:strand:- start:45 stop:458 length:414 start_codon:yes stop_codon:yes gene_type:complete